MDSGVGGLAAGAGSKNQDGEGLAMLESSLPFPILAKVGKTPPGARPPGVILFALAWPGEELDYGDQMVFAIPPKTLAEIRRAALAAVSEQLGASSQQKMVADFAKDLVLAYAHYAFKLVADCAYDREKQAYLRTDKAALAGRMLAKFSKKAWGLEAVKEAKMEEAVKKEMDMRWNLGMGFSAVEGARDFLEEMTGYPYRYRELSRMFFYEQDNKTPAAGEEIILDSSRDDDGSYLLTYGSLLCDMSAPRYAISLMGDVVWDSDKPPTKDDAKQVLLSLLEDKENSCAINEAWVLDGEVVGIVEVDKEMVKYMPARDFADQEGKLASSMPKARFIEKAKVLVDWI